MIMKMGTFLKNLFDHEHFVSGKAFVSFYDNFEQS